MVDSRSALMITSLTNSIPNVFFLGGPARLYTYLDLVLFNDYSRMPTLYIL